MTVLDIILIIILSGFIWFGLFFGLIHALGSLAGSVLGAWIAYLYYQPFAVWISSYLGFEAAMKVIAFLIVFAIVSRLISFVFYVIDKAYDFFSVIPFLQSINKLAGGILGFIEGCVVIGVVLILLLNYPFSDWLISAIENSQVGFWIISVVGFVMPFLMELYQQAKTIL